MLPKAHLTSHPRMSGFRWVITPSWLSSSWRSFFIQLFCLFLPPRLNIFCFCYVHTISVLYRARLCMKCSLGISNSIEEISSLSHSVVFLQWHHWLDGHESEWTLGIGDGQGGLACCNSWGREELDTTERLIWSDLISLHWLLRKAFLSLLAILWNSAFRCLYLSFSPLLFASLLFIAICNASSGSHFSFLHFFSMGMVLIPVSCTMSQTSVHSSSGTLSIR